MPVAESTSAVPRVETTVSAPTWKKLTTRVTGKPAPKPDEKNLWIEIDIDLKNASALFHCQLEEHVGSHKQRKVTFRADQDCLLRFTNQVPFSRELVQLYAHTEQPLSVKDEIGSARKTVETFYDIYIMTTPTESVTKTAETQPGPKKPPVIVVP
jgi:hypothetical protein